MPVTLVIGGQWGDEGKAKIVDYLAHDADYVVRYQGGANAGHTVVADGQRFAFHLLPSGVLCPHVTCVLGGGMVIDPIALTDEIGAVERQGIDLRKRLFVSEQAHLVLPYHVAMDGGSEDRLGKSKIGTTRKGITPAYVDKVGRTGMRMSDFRRPRAQLAELIARKIRTNNRALKAQGVASLPVSKTIDALLRAKRSLEPLIVDTRVVLWEALDQGRRILCEGAQGSLLDVDHGTYPFVTSSHPTAGGALVGAGLPPSSVDRVIGIFKAYCTRVGSGPFPTELTGKAGDRLRELGYEYGTTTGRPRRCGWFDAVAARTAVRLNGVTDVALTKLDVLDTFEEIRVCTSYLCGKKRLDYFPTDGLSLERCKPHYEVVKGWCEKTNGCDISTLPRRAKAYVSYLEELIGCRVHLVSLGPEREAMIRIA